MASIDMAGPASGWFEVGIVVKPHGIRGALKVRLHHPDSLALNQGAAVALAHSDEEQHFKAEVIGVAGGFLLVQAEGVSDRTRAEMLRGGRILVPRQSLDPLEDGQYYYSDLVGCAVVNEQGVLLGVVDHLFSAGASDILVVREGQFERLIPLVDDWVQEVDLTKRIIHISGSEQFEPQPVR
jgi:16S rRNA processing protein RimM